MDITQFITATGNKFAGVASEGVAAGDIAGYIDTGSYALNALLSGSIYKGVPSNRVTCLAAESGTGKTFVALSVLAHFLKENPDGIGLIFESEAAISKDMLEERGMDTKRVGIIPVVTVQDFKTQCLKVLENYEATPEKERKPLFLILDSLGMLSTNKELEDSSSGKDTRDMTRAQLVKAAFRVLTLMLGRLNVPLIITNHVYATIGSLYGGNTVAGGSGILYSSSTIVGLTKAQDKNAAGEHEGVFLTATAIKSRLTREKSKVKLNLKFDTGLDKYFWMLELAEASGLFKKVSTRYELPDGRKLFGKQIIENPVEHFTPEVLDKIDEYVQKTFKFGSQADDTVHDELFDDDSLEEQQLQDGD